MVDLKKEMAERVQNHMQSDALRRERVRNPAIPNNVFDFSGSGLPADFTYVPVEVPNPNSPLYPHQLSILNDYLWSGFQHLTDEWVTHDGRNGTAAIPNSVTIDGRIVVAGCYVLYADRDWYERRRRDNVESRNAILESQQESREESLDRVGGYESKRTFESERRDVTLETLDREEQGAEDDD